MGLAASQARLLTITSRKADCEFQSMRLSHQKIALSRNMTDISNEYQDALNQVSLVYDYYGTNDKSTVLSYGLLMTPGELNGHMPILTTDAAGKVVLNSRYAAAARAAGIPTEGLGCLPSTDVRNKFLDGLASAGFITPYQAEIYKEIEYNQQIGVGTTDLVTTTVTEMNWKELLDYYVTNCDYTVYDGLAGELCENMNYAENYGDHHPDNYENCSDDHFESTYGGIDGDEMGLSIFRDGSFLEEFGANAEFNIADLLNSNYVITYQSGRNCSQSCTGPNGIDDGEDFPEYLYNEAIKESKIWDWMFEEFRNMISIPGDYVTDNALTYAENKIRELLANPVVENHFIHDLDEGTYNAWDIMEPGNYTLGLLIDEDSNGEAKNLYWSSFNISLVAEAYLTYFAMKMEGANTKFKVGKGVVGEDGRNMIKGDDFKFKVVTEIGVNADQSLNSGHYDAMFNQLCLNGWVENDQVNDNEYLHHMYQSGKLFISTCNDDGFYYQGNYNTNKFIKEVADDEAIARAEAKYNSEKQRINSKEEVIDMKMKNLDTEISSLTTEYDTIKSLISNNIKKSFTRYDA